MNKYLDVFLTFAKVGVMTFGGGYAMLPILQREVVERKGWASEEELADYFDFANPSFFGKYFKQHTGMSPSEYKSQI